MSVTWTLAGAGWATVLVADRRADAEATASHLTAASEEFLTAVANLVLGAAETRAQFEAEPTAFRWIFSREGAGVRIRLLELPYGRAHDETGIEIWSSQQTVDTVARAVIRCFDRVASEYGESGYRDRWHRPFPRSELEVLRTSWRTGGR